MTRTAASSCCTGALAGQLLYRDELEQWRGRPELDMLVTVDKADEGWRGPVGVVTTLLERAEVDPPPRPHSCAGRR